MESDDYVIVFDLDDTLISETDYFYSGIKSVEKFISRLYEINFESKILEAHKMGIKDLWEWSCLELNLPIEIKESLKWVYRLHSPELTMKQEVSDLILKLKEKKIKIAIITDGRSISQRLKIKAIGLDDITTLISEECKSSKPNLKSFLEIEKIWGNKKYFYVGDNPKKDFIAPNKLKWTTICANWINPKIHNCDYKHMPIEKKPQFWLSKPHKLLEFLV